MDQGTAAPTTIYLSTVNGLATGGADYEAIEELPIHFSTKDLQKTIIVNTKSDTAVESVEDFYLLLYQTLDKVSENKYDKYSQAYIKNNASISLSKYSLKSSASYTSPAEEGEDIVFTIFRDSTGQAETIYVNTFENTADSSDFEILNHVPVYFSAHEQIKTITVKTNTDTSKEDPESFILKLYRTSGDYESGLDSLAVSQGHIADKVGTIESDQSHYTYSISTKHSTKEAKFSVSDQSNITTDTTITVKNSDNAITFPAKASGASGQEFNINTLSAKYANQYC